MAAMMRLHAPMTTATKSKRRAEPPLAVAGWFRLPGLFWSSEVELCGDEFLVLEAGHDRDGQLLYAVYALIERSYPHNDTPQKCHT